MLRIIVNPNAGSGRALEILPKAEQELRSRKIAYDVVQTTVPFQAAQLSKQAADEGIDGIVVIGGDGTLFEAVNGIAQTNTVLYAVSCGTGNDFIRSIHLPKDPIEALKVQLDSPISTIDVGAASDFRFLNIAGAGFDVEVLRQTERFKQKYHGLLPYLLGIVFGIKNYKPFSATLEVAGRKIEGKFTIMMFANGQYYGGGMRVARKADPFDGEFDVIYVPALPKWLIAIVIPLFLPGWYDVLPVAHRVRATSASLTSTGLTVNMDGELRDMDHVDFRILPGGVRMALPNRSK